MVDSNLFLSKYVFELFRNRLNKQTKILTPCVSGSALGQQPKVLIIVLNWNGLQDTIKCIESLKKMDYPNFDIIIVDNASTDGSAEIIERYYPGIDIIKNSTNLGFAGGNNKGMEYAFANDADYVWLLNNDTTVDKDSLSIMINETEKCAETGLVSPVIYYYDDPGKIQFCGSLFDYEKFSVSHQESLEDMKKAKNTDISLWGTALLIKKDVFNAVGYLNNKYFAYWEDAEYSRRSLEAGFKNKVVYDARIYHKWHNTQNENHFPLHYFYYMTRNEYLLWAGCLRGIRKILFMRKYCGKIFKKIGVHRDRGRYDIVNAMLDGLYCGIKNHGGSWQERRGMPRLIKKMIINHPFLCSHVVLGKFKQIFIDIVNKIETARISECQK